MNTVKYDKALERTTGHPRYSSCCRAETKEAFGLRHLMKVRFMSDSQFEYQKPEEFHSTSSTEQLKAENDVVMEQILSNINSTPLGRVLKKIASLPELRRRKVLGVRRQLTEGAYDLDNRLDVVVDKVLEELTG